MRANFNEADLLAAGAKKKTVLNPGALKDDVFFTLPNGFMIKASYAGELFVDFSGELLLGVKIPTGIDLKLVENFTSFENVTCGSRPIGEYRYRTAKAVLSYHQGGYTYHIKYVGKKVEDIAELHRRICEGTIHPYADHMAPLVPPPHRRFGVVLRELLAVVRRDIRRKLSLN